MGGPQAAAPAGAPEIVVQVSMIWMSSFALAQNPYNGDFEDGLQGWNRDNEAGQLVTDFRMGAGSPSGEHVARFQVQDEPGRRELRLRSDPFTVRRVGISFFYLIADDEPASLSFQIDGERTTLSPSAGWTGTGFDVSDRCGQQAAIELIHAHDAPPPTPGSSRSYVDLVIETGDACPGFALDTGVAGAEGSEALDRGQGELVVTDGCGCGQGPSPAAGAWLLGLLGLACSRRTAQAR